MRRTLISALLLSSLVACGDDEGGPATFIAAEIDGAEWRGEATEGEVVYYVEGSSVWVPAYRRVGGADQTLNLSLPYLPEVGTFALGTGNVRASWSVCPVYSDEDCGYWTALPGDPGVLTIASIEPSSGRMEGTFTFTGYFLGDSLGETREFSGGRFLVLAPSVFILE